jgi:cardiolipin synthase
MQRLQHAYRHSSPWKNEQVFTGADAFFAAMLHDLQQAQHSIDMDYYIFEPDKLGKSVIDHLVAAAKRGVQVRLMIDGLGSLFSANDIVSQLSPHGIAIKVFHPSPFALNLYQWSNTKGNMLEKFLHFFRHINQRNHHKLCLIDQQMLYTGSYNISQEHLSKQSGGANWHDIGVKISDPSLAPIQQAFDTVFHMQTGQQKKLYLQKMRNNFTALTRRIGNNLMMRQIGNAHERIWICSAYFSPSKKVLRAIKKARKRNIDVRIILPSKSDLFFIPILSRSYYKNLLDHGVIIYEYQPDILHAKILLIDQQCMIGSTNLNHRSFHHDLEMDIVLTHNSSIKAIEQQLLTDITASTMISRHDITANWPQQLFARFILLFRYWL